jgi:hypothetical protein
MAIERGLGICGLRTTTIAGGPTKQKGFPYYVFDFETSEDLKTEQAMGYVGGSHQVLEVIEGTSTQKLKLSTEFSSWAMTGLTLGLIERTLTSFSLPIAKQGTVPKTAPYTITDAEIIAGNAGSVVASIIDYGPWGQSGALNVAATAGTPAAKEFGAAAGTLTFNAAQAGAPIWYMIDRLIPSANVYGGPGQLPRLGELEFSGQLYDTSGAGALGGQFWAPRIKRASGPKSTYNGGKLKFETEFYMLAVPGWELPYMKIDGHSVV